ncbi:MAG: phage tail length tape measure family protein, partial [Pikeienuella sp.]
MVNLTPLEIRVTADTDQAEAGLRRVGTATDTASAKMQRGASGANNLGKSMQVTGAKSRAMRGNLQNTSFQLQDMVVQLQMGTKWTTVMGQQLPQLAGGFGAVGAAIGVVAAVGFAGLGLAMAALGEETKTLEERLDDLSEAVALYGQFSDTASLSTDKLSERFGAAGNEAQKVAAFLSDWARIEAVEEMDAAVAQLADDFGGLGGEMIQVTDQTRALAESILGAGVTEFSSELLATVSDLSSEFDISSQSAARLVDAMRGFSSAESVSDQVDAAAQLNRQFAAVFGTVENIPPELREVAKQAGLIALQAAEIEGNTEDAHAAFADLVSIVGSLGPAMSPALGAVQSLTAEFGSANKAASELYGTMLPMAIVEQASTGGRGGAGPGGPMGAAELFEARTGGVHLGDFGASDDAGVTGGGGSVNPLVGDLAALQEQLMTQEELLSTSYESQLET